MAVDALRERSPRSLARAGGFYLSIVAFLFFWLLAFNFGLMAMFTSWFDPALADTIHFVHNIALHAFVLVWGLAMLAQLYRPARRVTAMQVALVIAASDAVVGAIASGNLLPPVDAVVFFFGPTLVAAALHPARDEVFSLPSVDRESVDPVVLGVAGFAVLPMLLYVIGQVGLAGTTTDAHSALGHYATMSYVGVAIIALGLLAAVRTQQPRAAAFGAAVMAGFLGAASLFNPTTSALPPAWAVAAIVWAVVLVGGTEWSLRQRRPRATTGESSPTAEQA